ncbi:MAG: hypothetical protein IT452_03910 [Planctomycetia bacterium]|nr:hypothetical protein [Planctomycetia bacterium]
MRKHFAGLAFLAGTFFASVAHADGLTVRLDKDGGLSLDDKAVDAAGWRAALAKAAHPDGQDGPSFLELTLACDPATRWSALRGCLTDAAATGVWDVRLAVGDKTVPIPLPRDTGLPSREPEPPDARAAVSLVVTVVAPKDGKGDPEVKLAVDGKDFGALSAEAAAEAAKAVAEKTGGEKGKTPAVLNLDAALEARHLLLLVQALRDAKVATSLFSAGK